MISSISCTKSRFPKDFPTTKLTDDFCCLTRIASSLFMCFSSWYCPSYRFSENVNVSYIINSYKEYNLNFHLLIILCYYYNTSVHLSSTKAAKKLGSLAKVFPDRKKCRCATSISFGFHAMDMNEDGNNENFTSMGRLTWS